MRQPNLLSYIKAGLILLGFCGAGWLFAYVYHSNLYRRMPGSNDIAPVSSQKNYVEGEILVTFNPGTKVGVAEGVLNDYHLQYKIPTKSADLARKSDVTYSTDDSLNEGHATFVVSVPKGKEVEWIQQLGQNRLVKRSELDTFFNLQ